MPSPEPRVLVTGSGGPSGQCILRSLAGEGVELFSADIDANAAGLYFVDAGHRVLLPRGDREDFAAVLLDLCTRLEIDVLFATVDTELIQVAARRADFEAAGVTPVLAAQSTLETCLDKWVLHNHCSGRLRVPETVLVDADFDPAAVVLPVVVKPRSGSGSRGVRTVSTRTELEALPRDATLLCQELLPGDEHSLDVFARADGTVLAVVPRLRLKVDSGIAVTGRTVRDERLDAIGRQVAAAIGLTSVANVQVRQAVGGEPALLEVNPRFPGTMPLTIAAGVHMPRLALDEALGRPLPEGPIGFEEVAMVRFFDDVVFDPAELDAAGAEAARVHGVAEVAR